MLQLLKRSFSLLYCKKKSFNFIHNINHWIKTYLINKISLLIYVAKFAKEKGLSFKFFGFVLFPVV